jgi:phosphoglycerate dehydrogenase-like enzyme
LPGSCSETSVDQRSRGDERFFEGLSLAEATILLWTPYAGQRAAVQAALQAVEGINLLTASNEDEAVSLIPTAHAAVLVGAVTGYTRGIAEAIERTPRLRWVQILSAGIDGVELHGIRAGVSLTGIGDAISGVVAEHAMALLLAQVRKLPIALRRGETVGWDDSFIRSLRTLEDMRLCMIGCGGIGQAIARRARVFGAICVGVNRSGSNPAPELFEAVVPLERLTEVVPECGALVISVPLTKQTHGVLGHAVWRACQPGTIVVNVGRGAVIDTLSLLEALDGGLIESAALDVTDPEPLPPDHPLWKHPKALITPHLGAAGSASAMRRVGALAAENVRRFLRGESLKNPLTLHA